MSGESERQAIDREIFALRRRIDTELRYGSPERANELLSEIARLEQQRIGGGHESQ